MEKSCRDVYLCSSSMRDGSNVEGTGAPLHSPCRVSCWQVPSKDNAKNSSHRLTCQHYQSTSQPQPQHQQSDTPPALAMAHASMWTFADMHINSKEAGRLAPSPSTAHVESRAGKFHQKTTRRTADMSTPGEVTQANCRRRSATSNLFHVLFGQRA